MKALTHGALTLLLALSACDGDGDTNPNTNPDDGPGPGTTDDRCEVPAEALAADVSAPTSVVGTGTPQSCTSAAFVAAVAGGGVIAFDCGPEPVVITLDETAKIYNDTGPDIVIDGGDTVTLSGAGARRILYMNTCDEDLVWTTSHCNDQDHPRLTLQNLTFIDGSAKGLTEPDGGGAVFVRGGRVKVVSCRFFHNVCDDVGQDVGGGALRVFDQYQGLPVTVVDSTFGGSEALGNVCSNGGALSSIGVSWSIFNSLFSFNRAIGNGANPKREGTPGGGSGGAIYNDGNTFDLRLCGVEITDGTANEGGGAVFFVSNDRTGKLVITDSTLRRNPSLGFETEGYPGIFVLAEGDPIVENSVLE